MFLNLYFGLREEGLPVSLREYLDLVAAMDVHLAGCSVDDFYYLSRALLVKDEGNLDRFDRVFGEVFKGIERIEEEEGGDDLSAIPKEWLEKLAELLLSEDERRKIKERGWEELMEELRKRLAEQKGRHQGGSKWIGTAGTSPFGAYGYNPAGVRIGQDGNRNFSAVKVWDRRDFKDLDSERELGTRNMKLALRRLRRFAREGAAEELDLEDTIRATAKNAGHLELRLVPERHNAVKVLLLLDVGGSMDWHIRLCEELFSAARSEFKHLEPYYFHNCLYERVWRDNHSRYRNPTTSWQVLHSYPSDYKLIIVGDAAMSPYEIVYPGGSLEHYNEEAGEVWLRRYLSTYPKAVWLNPIPEAEWDYTASTQMLQSIMDGRMYPLTLEGLDAAMRELVR
ncbi:MAG: VWA domain-containing protein [Kiloniellales bacterium]|nr:VWA domain-containing protein [Kiloniellales bacterium]